MEFNDIIELFSVFKKLYTSKLDNDKTIFYRDVNNVHGKMRITRFDGGVDVFKLELVSHMSLSSWEGLLVQYDSLDGRKMFPYRLLNIRNIELDLE